MKFRRTKIIITLGPETSSPKMIEQLVLAGANAIRLNFSHGTIKEHLETIRTVRSVADKMKIPLPVLADLPGPKLRTGLNVGGSPVFLKEGSTCTLTTKPVLGTAQLIPVVYKNLPKYLNKGDRILLADGLLELQVQIVSGTEIKCRVITGGELGEHKGINLPGLRLKIPSLTEKDKEILKFLVKANVDYVAMSFVQKAQDVLQARSVMERLGKQIPIIAKIEKPEAVDHIHSILEVADGIMIARGDLGVEIPTARIPVVQKELIHLSALKFVPVITATQMLDSMVQNPRPTRAETTDVANAIWDGSDVVMLSNETAMGRHPLEAVRTMANIIDQAESHPDFQWSPPPLSEMTVDAHTILTAAKSVADPRVHKAIVTYTKTGSTAILLSKLRPSIPIFALTPDPNTYHRLGLVWGVKSFISAHGKSVDDMILIGDRILMKQTGLKRKDKVIMVAGTQLTTGATNLLKIHQIGESLIR